MPISKGIPAGKKRYTLTLTEATMDRMHVYLGNNHAPKSMLSGMVDDFLLDVLKTVDGLAASQQRKGEELTLGDLLTTMGTIMTERHEQGKLL